MCQASVRDAMGTTVPILLSGAILDNLTWLPDLARDLESEFDAENLDSFLA
jgi:hypothetical protein